MKKNNLFYSCFFLGIGILVLLDIPIYHWGQKLRHDIGLLLISCGLLFFIVDIITAIKRRFGGTRPRH